METDPSKSGSSMVPVAIGLVGVAMGAIALIMAVSKGNSAANDIAALKQTVADDSGNIATALQTAQAVDAKVSPLAQGYTALQNKLGQEVIPFIQQDHNDLKALTDKVDHMGSRPVAAAAGSSGEKSTVVPGQGGEYTVESNDNPTVIGKKFGVSAQAIIDDNPGLNPNKMKVGDKIHIPGASKPATTATHSAPPPPASPPATTTAP
jgi:LysM repeat protein